MIKTLEDVITSIYAAVIWYEKVNSLIYKATQQVLDLQNTAYLLCAHLWYPIESLMNSSVKCVVFYVFGFWVVGSGLKIGF